MDKATGAQITEQTRQLANGFNQFGLELHRLLPAGQNTFVSPVSVAAALAALYAGARGKTATEIAALLHMASRPDTVGPGVAGLRAALSPQTRVPAEYDAGMKNRLVGQEAFRLSLATALFVKEAYPLHTAFCEELTDVFGAEFFSDPFTDPGAAVGRINAWVSDRTEGRITNLLLPDAIGEWTRLILANAIYFMGKWRTPFTDFLTRPEPFFLSNGERIEVETMHQTTERGYWADDRIGAKAVRLPYHHGLSMLVLLPHADRLADVEAALSSELFQRINADVVPRRVDLQLPRVELRYRLSLVEHLQQLGMRAAFDDSVSDFRGITPSREPLWINEIVHEAWVKIDEAGTEAAAATAMITPGSALTQDRPDPIPFVVDRPFYVIIQDEQTGAILFLGRVMDPRV